MDKYVSGKTKSVSAKKRFGQNFITDNNLLQKIVSQANITNNTFVIEIGPGMGSLTELLLNKANKVLAYEIDSDLIPKLVHRFNDKNNLILVNRDILEVDINEDIKKYFPADAEIVMVSNLPYYITTPILLKFLETTDKLSRLVVMTQLEVARRLTSKPRSKDYNALSIAIDYRTDASFLFKVNRAVFKPVPGVDSAVIALSTPKNAPYPKPKDEKRFFTLVRTAFMQRRKTLANNLLAGGFSKNREEVESVLNKAKIPIGARAETLDTMTFINLANVLADNDVNNIQ
ncbi:MAG: 16S rRNA (adenine(1518)-N(6)/adenine(1519)-N(6))-dimethyltransferase RsmA [Candidatus Izemoplasmatales bacterium]|nr:16S rRNA (adenine(1518)-N(6)/adenine(1519)-N(6))-dimethyltransferase RsmA [Candidatus Izemoplasmatales bacterium]